MQRRKGRREATTREKIVQVILGFLMFCLFTAICLAVLIALVKMEHLGT